MINTTNATTRNITWRHLISAAATDMIHEIDIYINVLDPSILPTDQSYDFKGDRIGSDIIILSSDLTLFKNLKRDRIMVWIGVRARNPSTNFTLMNWGPQAYESQYLNFTDIKVKQPQNITLVSKATKPV